MAAINSQGVEDLFSDILYSNGKITVNEQELKLLRSPTPLSFGSGQESEDSDEDGSESRPIAANTSRSRMNECDGTDEEEVSLTESCN